MRSSQAELKEENERDARQTVEGRHNSGQTTGPEASLGVEQQVTSRITRQQSGMKRHRNDLK
jgi:hypothetical protein